MYCNIIRESTLTFSPSRPWWRKRTDFDQKENIRCKKVGRKCKESGRTLWLWCFRKCAKCLTEAALRCSRNVNSFLAPKPPLASKCGNSYNTYLLRLGQLFKVLQNPSNFRKYEFPLCVTRRWIFYHTLSSTR